MKFAIRAHQGKERPYRAALIAAGHVEETPADVVLVDYDLYHPAYNSWYEVARSRDVPLIAYPHGFSTTMAHDLVVEPIEVAVSFVPGEGQRRIMEAFGYPNPLRAVGWEGSHTEPEPREAKRVLFAPHHPLGSGFTSREAREGNAAAFQLLLNEPFDLVVRHVGSLEQNGLWYEEGVRYIQGLMDGTIHTADVVVSGGTYAADCLAYGVAPVVMYDQDQEWRFHSDYDSARGYPEGWQEWRDFVLYPYDLHVGTCAQAAAEPCPPVVREWKHLFLGDAFDGEGFVRETERVASLARA